MSFAFRALRMNPVLAAHPGSREAAARPRLTSGAATESLPRGVATLQRMGGNRALASLMASGALRRKVRVGAPGDHYEREADRVADAVMRMPDAASPIPGAATERTPAPMLQRCGGCAGGTPCAECARREQDALTIQRAPSTGTATRGGGSVAEAAIANLGAGSALDPGIRTWIEPRLGHAFGDVRVHTGDEAARAAASLSARAFTLGRHVVFGDAEYAPHTHGGRRLLAHELVHVVQQRGATDPLVQRELVYAGGYPNRFRSDAAEVGCVTGRDCKWSPSTDDFRAGAEKSGGGTGAASFSALLDHIAAAAPGSIHELGLIGHANSSNFGLSGTIDAHDVWFTDPGLINAETIAREGARIVGLRDRFAADAVITLYGCNAGAGQALIDAIGNAFQVCVKGFSNEIVFCIQWRMNRARTIFDRGRSWIDDPMELRRPEDIGCANFHANVRDNTPDRESKSCAPAPVTAPEPTVSATSPRRFGLEFRAGAAASDEAWRAALGVGLRYSLRSDQAIIWNPTIGGQLVYLPTSGDRVSHIAAVIAELGLRIQQPLEGFYFDVRAGAYAGIEVPGAGSTEGAEAVGGFTPAAGLGYHSERFSLGAEARGLVGAGPNQFIVVGAGAWHW